VTPHRSVGSIRSSYEGGPGKHAAVSDNVLMARFLIIEPHEDIRRLYAGVVRGLGHEPIFFDAFFDHPDVILVEPSDPDSLEGARRLRYDYPNVPIICASIHEPAYNDVEVLQAVTYLVKPFSLFELTNALQLALSQSPRS
jgi:DNA-binding response OmpR family regulator